MKKIGCLFLLYSISSYSFAQIEFIENKGQWNEEVKYKSDFSSGAFFLKQNGFAVLMHDLTDLNQLSLSVHGDKNQQSNADQKVILHSFIYNVDFLGSSNKVEIIPEKASTAYNNYYIGNDQAKWTSHCKIFQTVTYKNIYPNIDVRFYTASENLKYDFIIHPGGNPNQIAIRYNGPQNIKIQHKELVITTGVGVVKELSPYSFQQSPLGTKELVECKYVLANNVVTFKTKNYDPGRTLIIDPSIIFSTFTGSSVDNWGYTATPGPDGSFYAGGIAFGNGYLSSPGAYQTVYQGGVFEGQLKGHDIAIFKFNSNGSARLYATYLGGSSNEQPHSMITDAQGNLIVAGRSTSTDYPKTIPQIGSGGGSDIIITKFNADGTSLIGSVKIGGSSNDGVNIRSKYENPDGADRLRRNYGDDARSEVILDKDNNIILTSCTQSNNFPVIGASLNSSGTFGGGLQDGLVLKFNSTISSYLFGSYFGGSGDDACFVASLNPLNNVLYVAGGTTSTDLPGNKVGVISNVYNGGITDGYISSLKLDGTGIIKTTYLGTTGVDIVYGLKFDRLGFPYVMGTTTGTWPVVNATYSNPNSSQFISKLKPDFSGMVYSTVFGNGSLAPNLSPIGFMVDRCENVYVSGWGGGINVYKNYSTGTTNGLPLLNPLSGVGTPDGEDFYFFVLKKNAAGLLFASNFGQYKGNTGDHVDGGTSRFDENGTIYQAICANCNGGSTFPTTIGAWSRINGSINCNEAAVKIEMNFTGVTANAQASINGVKYDTAGCIPFRVDFTDTLQKAKKIYWNFGNGVKDTTIAPNFTTYANYNTVGTYTVTIIAEDSTTCNVRDTFYLKIKAGDNLARLAFNAIKELPCTGLAYSFNNLSIPTRGSFNSQSFIWDYGDGSPKQTSFNGYHVFPSIGTYTVTLELIDNNFCNAPDKITKKINVNPLVEAKFTTAAVGCAPYTATFTNLSGTSDVTWQFSDGTSTNTENPIKVFNIPGSYQVRLIARDTNTCNKIDTSAYFTILVSDKPNASFGWQPNPPLSNTPIQFTNTSIDATHYLWQFGDGATSTLTNPAHLYNESGDFTVVLIAYNQYECADTFSLMVKAIIDPLLDVPNAFTPGKFGENSVIKVKGFGIGKLDWKIYNRWGQMIFQTNDLKVGWDGTFKGKLQPMDVYVYTLEATLTNGQKIKKSGDITLLK